MPIKRLNTGLYDLTLSSHIIFYHTVSYGTCLCKQQQLSSWIYVHECHCVSDDISEAAAGCLWTGAAADITLSLSLSACASAHVSVRVCLCVCICPQMYQHVCTLMRTRDNVLLCVEGAGEKPNSQGHSSSASSCPVSAPSLLTCRENGDQEDFHNNIQRGAQVTINGFSPFVTLPRFYSFDNKHIINTAVACRAEEKVKTMRSGRCKGLLSETCIGWCSRKWNPGQQHGPKHLVILHVSRMRKLSISPGTTVFGMLL